MFTSRKFWLISVGTGLVFGIAVTAWLFWQKSQMPSTYSISSTGGSGSSLNLTSGGSSSDSGGTLPIVTDGNQGSTIDSTNGSESGDSGQPVGSDAGSAGTDYSDSSSGLPGPSSFGQYDAYKSSPTALFIDIQPGSGKAIAQGSVATVQYEGWLTDGTEFDSTYARKQAFTFTEGAGQVIPGWEEAIFGMKVGGERRLIIPPGLAFGATAHATIPANSVLIFDVALVSIK